MCPAHRDLPTPSHPHSRLNLPHPIPSHTYNASRLFHSQQPLQAVLLHRLNLSFPAPSHTDTSQQNSRPPQPRTPKKSPRGVQRGHGFMAPLRFSSFPTKPPKNIFLPTFHSKVCIKINKILVVFTIKKVYHIKINYKQ